METDKLIERYGQSKDGNFFIADTIGVPHSYCITSRHVVEAADHHSGMLSQYAIEAAEKKGIRCGTRGCRLSFAEHKQALLVSCKEELKDTDGKINAELHEYLLACKSKCEEDEYEGFAFVKA